MDLKNKNILITGGTGTLGVAFTRYLLNNFKDINKIIIYSRDEQKQFKMALEFPTDKFKQIRYFIGDVRDLSRLKRALNNVDYVVHAAAMKHIHIAEYNPDECIKTNINGAINVIEASIFNKVKKVVALSTDKASSPSNLYGATKLTSDKLFISANNLSGKNPTIFSVVRYGNVMGSNGSVIPFFIQKSKSGILPITDKNMTRFNILIDDGIKMIMHAFSNAWGGEIYVPKIPSYKVMDIAKAICEKCKYDIVGIRPGEKIHE